MHLTLIVVFSFLILAAGAGFLLMIFPAHLFLILITLTFGLIDHFQHLKLWEWGILTGVAVTMICADWLSGLLGAKFSGASKKSLFWGLVGTIIGLIVLPPFGSLIGLFLGVLIAESSNFAINKKAIRAASGSVLGTVAGVLINLVLTLFFLILFIIFALH